MEKTRCGSIVVEVLPDGEQTSYLGRVINLRDLHDSEVHNRIAKAWTKFGVSKGEFVDPAIPMHLRTKLFDAVVTRTILYGSEVWSVTLHRQQKLRAAQRRMMRQIIHAHRSYDRYDNHVEWIKAETSRAEKTMHDHKVECCTILQRRKMRKWAEKLALTEGERWDRAVVTWCCHESRPRGRPRSRWHDVLKSFLEKTTGRTRRDNDWQKVALNADAWWNLAKVSEKETSLTPCSDMEEQKERLSGAERPSIEPAFLGSVQRRAAACSYAVVLVLVLASIYAYMLYPRIYA